RARIPVPRRFRPPATARAGRLTTGGSARPPERAPLRPARFRRTGDQTPMKLSRIEIQAFGCLSDFAEDIAPGLHIFHGPNESGKSTLQQAVLALLYGFYEGDRAKATENAARHRFVPWKHPRYTARLEYELQDGHRYLV